MNYCRSTLRLARLPSRNDIAPDAFSKSVGGTFCAYLGGVFVCVPGPRRLVGDRAFFVEPGVDISVRDANVMA